MSKTLPFFTSALILSTVLSACGGGPSSPTASDPYAGGASYPWSYIAPANKLSALTLTPGENALYYEPLLAASNAWGPIEIDRSNGEQGAGDGKPLTLNGVVYKKGFGTHANSEMRYSLKGTGATCTTFTADIGVDDEVGSRGSVVFQVFLDGVKKYDSGTLTGSSATKKVSVNITGAQELRMVVTNAGDGLDYDHANWADPRITCVATTPPPQPSGSLDPTFGTNGIANVGGVDAVLEPDNSILIADTVNGDFALKRLMPGGSVQQVTTDFGGSDTAYALVRQPNGKIVVAGSSNNRFALARYNTNLSLDTGFGVGGKVTTSASTLGSYAYAVAVQPDGKIVVAGTALRKVPDPSFLTSNDLATVRYTTSGQLDPSFGTGGISLVGFDAQFISYSEDEARAVVIQPGGGIVIAGKSDGAGGARLALLTRLTPGGALDTGFGSGGAVGGDDYSIFSDVAQEANGNLVVVGYENRYYGRGVVRRYSPNGSLLGQAIFTFTPDDFFDLNVLAGVVVQPDGKLLISGISQSFNQASPGPQQTVLARLNPNLSLDASFGMGGKVVVPVAVDTIGNGYENPALTPLRQSDGKIVLVGKQTARLFP